MVSGVQGKGTFRVHVKGEAAHAGTSTRAERKDVVFSIDLRHPDSATLPVLADAVAPLCQAHAAPCNVEVTCLSTAISLEFPLTVRDTITHAATRLNLPHRDILSTAGHDARYLHEVCPSGMIFVPSHLGLTHCEAESSSPSDLADGARVLADVLVALAA